MSPFQQFRRWNRLLSVTDLVAPSWCEVQFDYGLRQKRYKKLEDRPLSFNTAEGHTITVVQHVAAQNDRTVARGKSVHKVLEREVQAEAVPVDVTTQEERWGLRLVNMLTALETLLELGYCREMPVFGIMHDQVVTGLIDEIGRRPVNTETALDPQTKPIGTGSPSKRPAPSSSPATPFKSTAKKSKHGELSADQPPITAFFTPGRRPTNPITPSDPALPPLAALTRYSLHISDTKTRMRPTLPPEEDTFASRVQLMLYHRLLSNLLASAIPDVPASAPLDFTELWARVGVDPTRRFSDTFLAQAGLVPSLSAPEEPASTDSERGLSSLSDLVAAFKHAVQALNVCAVDNTLTLVYRQQPKGKHRKDEGNAANTPRSQTAALLLSSQIVEDLASAAEKSVKGFTDSELDGNEDLALAIVESLKDSLRPGSGMTVVQPKHESAEQPMQPFGVPISQLPGSTTLQGEAIEPRGGPERVVGDEMSADPQLAWALQQSWLEASRPVKKAAMKETMSAAQPAPLMLAENARRPQGSASVDEKSPAVADDNVAMLKDDVFETQPVPFGAEEDMTHPEIPAQSSQLTNAQTAAEPAGGDGPDDDLTTTAPASPAGSEEWVEADPTMTVAELDVAARILGTKVFELDDGMLDRYLTRVLAWWHGERPPEGVSVELTRRCMTCEYREGCEWRYKKAREAQERYRDGTHESSAESVATWV
ncbi:exonuclease V [Trametes punicea]|nr:exonuclease V [Trametes punicea]